MPTFPRVMCYVFQNTFSERNESKKLWRTRFVTDRGCRLFFEKKGAKTFFSENIGAKTFLNVEFGIGQPLSLPQLCSGPWKWQHMEILWSVTRVTCLALRHRGWEDDIIKFIPSTIRLQIRMQREEINCTACCNNLVSPSALQSPDSQTARQTATF